VAGFQGGAASSCGGSEKSVDADGCDCDFTDCMNVAVEQPKKLISFQRLCQLSGVDVRTGRRRLICGVLNPISAITDKGVFFDIERTETLKEILIDSLDRNPVIAA
jgi:hypothetical protein